mmetsp:Transcript_9168/g.22983  ORF Transcript_9168/g.22983 Transcript_9168/m.22983 type:complete len:280 (-) Transcript_9168:27-866(-)
MNSMTLLNHGTLGAECDVKGHAVLQVATQTARAGLECPRGAGHLRVSKLATFFMDGRKEAQFFIQEELVETCHAQRERCLEGLERVFCRLQHVGARLRNWREKFFLHREDSFPGGSFARYSGGGRWLVGTAGELYRGGGVLALFKSALCVALARGCARGVGGGSLGRLRSGKNIDVPHVLRIVPRGHEYFPRLLALIGLLARKRDVGRLCPRHTAHTHFSPFFRIHLRLVLGLVLLPFARLLATRSVVLWIRPLAGPFTVRCVAPLAAFPLHTASALIR